MYDVRVLDPALRDLKRLDTAVARRILNRLTWLGDHFSEIRPEALKGDLAGLFKFRVGDYRVIYEPLYEEELVMKRNWYWSIL